jgi:hypothetical protein
LNFKEFLDKLVAEEKTEWKLTAYQEEAIRGFESGRLVPAVIMGRRMGKSMFGFHLLRKEWERQNKRLSFEF